MLYNLSTARAAIRAREIGVRKMSGATRSILIRQFMIESFFITISAGLFSILFILLLLPLFNAVAGKELSSDLLDPEDLLGVFINYYFSWNPGRWVSGIFTFFFKTSIYSKR
ncbi:MAG: FtsX-like permease family protein [Cytophagales bacterium]|nr:FtsX-like permease family protein [Cytophagales bacterium]